MDPNGASAIKDGQIAYLLIEGASGTTLLRGIYVEEADGRSALTHVLRYSSKTDRLESIGKTGIPDGSTYSSFRDFEAEVKRRPSINVPNNYLGAFNPKVPIVLPQRSDPRK